MRRRLPGFDLVHEDKSLPGKLANNPRQAPDRTQIEESHTINTG